MLSVLGNRNFALLWSAALISGIGDFVLIAALPYFVYSISGSTIASGLAFFSDMAPAVVFSAIGGIFADRWRRKRVMVAGDWLRGAVLLLLLGVHSAQMLWIVYATSFLVSAIANFSGPFGSAAVPHVVSKGELPAANAAFTAGRHASVLVGAPLGGLLLQQIGLNGVVVADAVSFVLSGALIAGIRAALQSGSIEPATGQDEGSAVARAWRDWQSGLRYIFGLPWLSIYFAVATVIALGNSTALVLLAPFVRQVLGGSPQLYSWLLIAQAIGAIAAAPAMGRATARFSILSLFCWSVLLFGVLNVIIAVTASVPVTLVATLLGGVLVLFIVVGMSTVLQSGVDDRYLGRVFGADRTTGALMGLLGSILAGSLGEIAGIQVGFGTSGALLMAAGIGGLVFLIPAAEASIQSSRGRSSDLPSG